MDPLGVSVPILLVNVVFFAFGATGHQARLIAGRALRDVPWLTIGLAYGSSWGLLLVSPVETGAVALPWLAGLVASVVALAAPLTAAYLARQWLTRG